MNIAYLILAHRNPKLIKRTVSTLSSAQCGFFIHIDAKSNVEDFSGITGENLCFIRKRIPVHWGEYSVVAATLLLIREAMDAPRHYDYLVLISGSDYPLRSGNYIQAFLEGNFGLEFLDSAKMPALGKPISRISTRRFPSDKPIRKFAARGLAKMGLARRDYKRYLGSLEPYSGGMWWCLSRSSCQYILNFIASNERVVKYFEETFAPDESFFHTILSNSAFASRIRRSIFYADWSAQGAHPAMINGQHLALFEGQEKVCVSDTYGSGEVLFARKFSDDSVELLDRVDQMIGRDGYDGRRAKAIEQLTSG
jgi:hypothetical protein